jgi:tyrosinase
MHVVVGGMRPRDAGNHTNSPVLDPVTGFGGNGTGTDFCVTGGPFANSTLTVGPETSCTPEGFCPKRKVNETYSAGAAESIIDTSNNLTNYANAAIWCIGASPHTA